MKTISKATLISLFPIIIGSLAHAQTDVRTATETTASEKHRIASGWRASEVIGTDVKNAGDETIGEVEDLVVDMKSGEILAVVVSSGGFLGIADTLSTIPSDVLRYDHRAKGFKTKLTKEQLAKAPQFKKDAWPDYGDASSWSGIHEYRNWIGGATPDADNTANNKKDSGKDAVTPMDQGSSDADVQMTRKIRAAIIEEDLSFDAKNIKVITQNGKVTLRGAVDKESEKETILEIAKKHAGDAEVTNELAVKNR